MRIKKSEIITLRVTPRTKETIRERAKAAGLTVTDYLCYSGLAKEIVRVEGLEQVLSELKAQGRNLNQLTTLANMGRVTVVKGDTLAENYGKIYEQLRELLQETSGTRRHPGTGELSANQAGSE
ncbi:plasmid mobilization relaxosome protein MobC [Flintibacter sp. KGMB00164]|uniref:plasmid mobilization protein n=1 Tax=Flintibacter sp. KGMB00164 TaxID=2610895 RepID=UPI001783FFCC|nr:plasmid mobilization relaxosome protein MobC [Flintibacter sp. KGMB00164]